MSGSKMLKQAGNKALQAGGALYQAVSNQISNVSNALSNAMSNSRKIVLIGETGSGKTSFLNLLCNYGELEELREHFNPETGYDHFKDLSDSALERASMELMGSRTNGAKCYHTKMGKLEVGIIDTPGFGDSRGFKQDEENVKMIVDALLEEEKIHTIFLIINGRNSRMTPTLKYVMTQIASILPKEVMKNIVVVFTNTANTACLSFNVEVLNGFFGSRFTAKNVLCIENPYCTIQKAKKQTKMFPKKKILKDLVSQFQDAAAALKEMISTIEGCSVVYTKAFNRLYSAKQEIEIKVLDILSEYDQQTEKEKKIEKVKVEITAAGETKSLYSNYTSIQTVPKICTEKTEHHNTLCGAESCYSNCHTPCTLPKSLDKEMFRNCAAMIKSSGQTCSECGHPYHLHYHNEVKWVTKSEDKTEINTKMKAIFDTCESEEERAKQLKIFLEQELTESKCRRAELSKKLLLSIQEFSILGCDRSYAKFIESQLGVIEQRLKGGLESETKGLKEVKEQLEKQLHVVKETLTALWKSPDQTYKKELAMVVLGLKPEDECRLTKRKVSNVYHAIARTTHPDKGGNNEAFKQLDKAKEILLEQTPY